MVSLIYLLIFIPSYNLNYLSKLQNHHNPSCLYYKYQTPKNCNILKCSEDKLTKEKIKNEILFSLNKKTKVYIHIEELIKELNIYHIGISFKTIFNNIRYDIVGINLDKTMLIRENRQEKTIFWSYCDKTLDEIIEYEKNLEYKYILGIYDCRHYVRNISLWATNKTTPIWNLSKLVTNYNKI
tara:strand:+ start:340 stop:888 length:549 start_codon:yes stop_codon:yes gene_type:complete